MLGRLQLSGRGIPQGDDANGARLVKLGADGGNMEALGLYGALLQQGIGVAKDPTEGAVALKRAADSHDSDAEQYYAIAFFNGQGVAQDEAAGAAWQKRAADDGNDDAAAIYCVRRTTGSVAVPKDAIEGVRYGRMAAAAGNARGQTCLGFAYLRGNGVPKDLVQAKAMFKLAAARDYADAVRALKAPELAGTP